jgi:alkyl sulfatase BDS1-like metallo-beta-lactamase superfamily hydrolase
MSFQSIRAAPATVAANRDAVALYGMANRQDFADAERGLIAPLPEQVRNADGQVFFDARRFDFIHQLERLTPSTRACGVRRS